MDRIGPSPEAKTLREKCMLSPQLFVLRERGRERPLFYALVDHCC
jgi:hypothetical protein